MTRENTGSWGVQMTKPFTALLSLTAISFAVANPTAADPSAARWPQFHGPDGLGVAADGVSVPREFGPNKNVLWKTPLPRGHSSPCIWDDHIYLTGCEKGSKKLETFCRDRTM